MEVDSQAFDFVICLRGVSDMASIGIPEEMTETSSLVTVDARRARQSIAYAQCNEAYRRSFVALAAVRSYCSMKRGDEVAYPPVAGQEKDRWVNASPDLRKDCTVS